jgi:hypothetical protein
VLTCAACVVLTSAASTILAASKRRSTAAVTAVGETCAWLTAGTGGRLLVGAGGGMVGRLIELNPPWPPVVPDLLAVALTSLRGTNSLGGEDTGMGAVNTMPTPVPYKVGPEGNTVPLGVVGEGMLCVVTGALVGGAVLTGRMDGAGRESSSPAIGALYTTPVGVPYRTQPAEVVAGTVCCCTVGTELMDCGVGVCMIGVAVVLVGTVAVGMLVPTSGASDGGARIAGIDGKGMLMGVVVTTLDTVAVVGMAVVAHVALMLVGTGVWMDAAVVTVEATEIAAAVVLTDAVGCVDGVGAAVVVVVDAVITAVDVAVVTAGVDTGIVTVMVHVVTVVVTVTVGVVVVAVVAGVVTAVVAVTTGVTMVVLMGGTAAVTSVGSMTGAVSMSISSPRSACVSMSIGVGCSGVHVTGMQVGGVSVLMGVAAGMHVVGGGGGMDVGVGCAPAVFLVFLPPFWIGGTTGMGTPALPLLVFLAGLWVAPVLVAAASVDGSAAAAAPAVLASVATGTAAPSSAGPPVAVSAVAATPAADPATSAPGTSGGARAPLWPSGLLGAAAAADLPTFLFPFLSLSLALLICSSSSSTLFCASIAANLFAWVGWLTALLVSSSACCCAA